VEYLAISLVALFVSGLSLFSGFGLVRTPTCYNCVRFYKLALKEKSATFRWLNRFFNPVFGYFLNKIITEEERGQATRYAHAAIKGHLDREVAERWMEELKTGF